MSPSSCEWGKSGKQEQIIIIIIIAKQEWISRNQIKFKMKGANEKSEYEVKTSC